MKQINKQNFIFDQFDFICRFVGFFQKTSVCLLNP